MSNPIYTLDASLRADQGKGASRRLRHAGLVPAIVYGGNEEPLSISLAHNKLVQAQQNEGFYSHVLTLNVEGKTVEAILKDVQRHPYKAQILHLDFQRVVKGQALHTNVPVHFVGDEVANKKGGTVSHHIAEIEITCLPKDLPEFIEVDTSGLAVGQTLHLSDVKFPAGVSSVELGKGAGHDQAVATLTPPKGGASEATEEAAE